MREGDIFFIRIFLSIIFLDNFFIRYFFLSEFLSEFFIRIFYQNFFIKQIIIIQAEWREKCQARTMPSREGKNGKKFKKIKSLTCQGYLPTLKRRPGRDSPFRINKKAVN